MSIYFPYDLPYHVHQIDRKRGDGVKIKEFAESQGVSRQAVYNAIRKKGLQADKLTDDNGDLTEEGLATVQGLFSGSSVNRKPDKLLQTVNELKASVDKLSELLTAQQKTIDEQAAVIKSLTESVDRLSKTADRESINVSQAQQITAMLKISREPLLKRLFAGKKEPEQQ